jgi:hypothetical protein
VSRVVAEASPAAGGIRGCHRAGEAGGDSGCKRARRWCCQLSDGPVLLHVPTLGPTPPTPLVSMHLEMRCAAWMRQRLTDALQPLHTPPHPPAHPRRPRCSYRYQAWQDTRLGRQKVVRDGVESVILLVPGEL